MKENERRFVDMLMAGAILVFGMLSVWLLIYPRALGNMNRAYQEPVTGSSDISFRCEAGDRIKLWLKSDVDSGRLDIILYDSQGNPVYEIEDAGELVDYFLPDYGDAYTLAAEYEDFTGKYEIAVYREE